MPVMTIKPGDHDPVKKPGHYTYGRYECIDIIEDILADASGPEAFLIGNAIKYLWRFRHKNGTEDLEKARWYLDRAITRRRAMNGTRADTAVFDVFPGIIQQENGRAIYNRITAAAAARYIGRQGEFFDEMGGNRAKGMLVKIGNDSPVPFLGRVCIKSNDPHLVAHYGVMPYKFFSPLNPEPPELPETGAEENPQDKPDA